jgi:hypothetical protein
MNMRDDNSIIVKISGGQEIYKTSCIARANINYYNPTVRNNNVTVSVANGFNHRDGPTLRSE